MIPQVLHAAPLELESVEIDIAVRALTLETIRDARGDINQIRILLKGSEETCNDLFRKAVEEGDAVLQIQLSHAFFGMRWGKDKEKDFSSLHAHHLETFSYYPRAFQLFNSVYARVMGVQSDEETCNARAQETFQLAASFGYLPAFLELKCVEWEMFVGSYGFAVQLQPFVGKDDRLLDYYFGQALKNGSQMGSDLYYEGMYWMNQSCGICVEYPIEGESFGDFTSRYMRSTGVGRSYYDLDGLRHVVDSPVVLARNKEIWEGFVKGKLSHVRFAPPESYSFRYDPAEIKSLLNERKIRGTISSTILREERIESKGRRDHEFSIHCFTLYENGERMGVIAVRENSFEIHNTFKNPEIQPIIDLIENVMTRTGSPESALLWLKQMGGRYI